MEEVVYTLGAWRVKPGKEVEFVAEWKALGKLFAQLPLPPGGKGTLVQSLSDPLLFYSFGAWSSMEAIQAMRKDATAQEGIKKVGELCSEATPGSFRVVAEVEGVSTLWRGCVNAAQAAERRRTSACKWQVKDAGMNNKKSAWRGAMRTSCRSG